jgi:hypothetical protein
MRRWCCIPWLVWELACPLAILSTVGWLAWRALAAAHHAWLRFAAPPVRVILVFGRPTPVPLLVVKLITFVLLLAMLYLIARLVAQRKQRAAKAAAVSAPALTIVSTALRAPATKAALQTRDIPTIELPQIIVGDDALCIPPRIHNYHFAHTDLVRGPADPRDFYDEFFLEMEDPADGHLFTERFTVATPAGLARLMREEGVAHLFPESFLIISNFNLGEILTAVLSRYADFSPANPVAPQHTAH